MKLFGRNDYSTDSDSNEPKVNKSRKPPNTAFRQQRLKAWQPIMTPGTVIPFLFILTAIFAPLGIGILITVLKVEKVAIDYSHCDQFESKSFSSIPRKYIDSHFNSDNKNPDFKWRSETHTDSFGDKISTCIMQFDIPKDVKPPIYLYYHLTNFYQNHRKYVESYDLEQLKGIAVTPGDLASDCGPLKFQGKGEDRKIIYPCGLIANSYFNDSISNLTLLNAKSSEDNETYVLDQTEISWSSDIKHKYKKTHYDPKDIVPPPNWYKMFPQGYNALNLPDLQQWQLLQNWMRTAGLASFYKLYGVNKHDTLTSGNYEVLVEMNYPVSIFHGTKSLVITTNSIFGGRNVSLGIVYIIVAVITGLLGIYFLLQTVITPRKVGDHDFLQNREQL